MTLKIERFAHVYPPQTDTFFLMQHICPKPADIVLELCTGCGIIALHLAQTAQAVYATDINPYAIANARHNAKINGLTNISIHHGDLYEPVNNRQFDLIVANPPYVPTPPDWQEVDILETAWNAGPDGRLLIDRIIVGLKTHLNPNGRFVLVQSNLGDIQKTTQRLQAEGFSTRVLARKSLPFGPVCRGRFEWLKQQVTFTSCGELLTVIEATLLLL